MLFLTSTLCLSRLGTGCLPRWLGTGCLHRWLGTGCLLCCLRTGCLLRWLETSCLLRWLAKRPGPITYCYNFTDNNLEIHVWPLFIGNDLWRLRLLCSLGSTVACRRWWEERSTSSIKNDVYIGRSCSGSHETRQRCYTYTQCQVEQCNPSW